MPVPLCENCEERDAQCRGAYEGIDVETFSCGECCGHGNEDGYCSPLCHCCGDVISSSDEMFEVLRFPDDVFCETCAGDYANGLHDDPSDDDVALQGGGK